VFIFSRLFFKFATPFKSVQISQFLQLIKLKDSEQLVLFSQL